MPRVLKIVSCAICSAEFRATKKGMACKKCYQKIYRVKHENLLKAKRGFYLSMPAQRAKKAEYDLARYAVKGEALKARRRERYALSKVAARVAG